MKRASVAFSLLFAITIVFGQYDPRENFYDAEFFLAEEDYEEALYTFTQVYNDGYQDNANINYRMGICLLNVEGKKKESIPYFELASKSTTDKYKEGNFKETNAPIDVFLYLGNAYRIDRQFDKAIKSYNNYISSVGDGVESEYAKLQIKACEKARGSKKSLEDYSYGTLGQINKISVPIYNAVVSGDLKTLAFMGKHKFYDGVYIARNKDGKWLKPINITPSIQSDGDQTVLDLSYDGNKLLLSRANEFESDIYMAEYKNDRWYPSKPIGKPINSKYYESDACFTPDGKMIYFTSNRKESIGDMDIFRCRMNEDGSLGDVELIESNINTTLNEDYPFVSPDGSRLYFSSQGHEGFGGFDIYYSEIHSDGSLGAPVNIGYPLNTTDDDFAFSPRDIKWDNYITLYAKGDKDQVDVFRFEWIPETAQPVVVAFEPTDEEEALAEEVVEEAEEVVENVQEAVEEVKDSVKEVVEEIAEEPEQEETPQAQSYALKPVYFGFDSWELSDKAKMKLEKLSQLFTSYPKLNLIIIGYADSQGPDVYNVYLSEQRAKAVMDFLKEKGIDENRMEIQAMGEKEPVAVDTYYGRPYNRRVQFKAGVSAELMIETDNTAIPDDLKISK